MDRTLLCLDQGSRGTRPHSLPWRIQDGMELPVGSRGVQSAPHVEIGTTELMHREPIPEVWLETRILSAPALHLFAAFPPTSSDSGNFSAASKCVRHNAPLRRD